MDGLLVVNKPKGLTSHDVVNIIRKIFKTKQVGHLGTLDPLATGVLVLCIGSATKLVQFLENVRKTYICEVTLGIETDSYDITGNVIKKIDVSGFDYKKIDQVLDSFKGRSKQFPPLFSAIKKDGKKLYEYARKNIDVKVDARDIEIFDIKRVSDYKEIDGTIKFSFETEVSKGTYIRSICHDLGQKLKTYGTLSNLERTKNGDFSISRSYTLEQIENGEYELIKMEDAIKSFPVISCEALTSKARHGMKISFNDIKNELDELPSYLAFIYNEELIAIYLKDDELHCYKAGRVWS